MTKERYDEIAKLVVCGAAVSRATKNEAERKAFSRMRDKFFLPPKQRRGLPTSSLQNLSGASESGASESVPSVAEIEREMLFALRAGLRAENTAAIKVAIEFLKLRDPKYSEKTQKFTAEDFSELWKEMNTAGNGLARE